MRIRQALTYPHGTQQMRSRVASWLIGFCLLATGCRTAENAICNLKQEVKLAGAEVHEHHRYRALAKAHWEQIEAESGRAFSKDFETGFVDGFVDHLTFGGNNQAPSVPPKHYWATRYRTPEGHRAIEDWYAGFRLGVTTAQQSGYRQWITTPSGEARGGAPGMPVPGVVDEIAKRSTPKAAPVPVRTAEVPQNPMRGEYKGPTGPGRVGDTTKRFIPGVVPAPVHAAELRRNEVSPSSSNVAETASPTSVAPAPIHAADVSENPMRGGPASPTGPGSVGDTTKHFLPAVAPVPLDAAEVHGNKSPRSSSDAADTSSEAPLPPATRSALRTAPLSSGPILTMPSRKITASGDGALFPQGQLGVAEFVEELPPTPPIVLPPLSAGTSTNAKDAPQAPSPRSLATFGNPSAAPLRPDSRRPVSSIRNDNVGALPPVSPNEKQSTTDR